MTSTPEPGMYARAQALYEQTLPLLMAGNYEKAIPLCRAAVDAHRVLVEVQDEYLLDFAIVLNNLATVLTTTGRQRDAVEPLREELDVRRRLAAGGDPGHRNELGRVLSVLGVALATTGTFDEGEAMIRESIRIRRPLAEAEPAVYRLPLGESLADWSRVLYPAERFEDARSAAAEAVSILRGIPGDDHLRSLAEVRHMHGLALGRTGSEEAALGQLAEATETFLRLPHSPLAARCFNDYANYLARAGHIAAAAGALISAIAVSQAVGKPAELPEENLRNLYQTAPTVVAEQWKRSTGTKPPRWLTRSKRR
ncbi:tetratricopeptide repeat protein [Pseudonocardia sp. DSM 110487]|uniref:tetratricopeptide repeat protein n=1 Tax=Pseudonocardia sp. DSM 110487 TaxID=2865833 RepID=UPI001C6A7F94|nr:tetratricopeptide repeat protein [Pseudonocardia sp. DSM 110487]QYN33980.1 tetratricopeptide repeat protein [Pseudonocardia sp. DSM 110487]